MVDTIHEWVAALEQKGCKPKQKGNGWQSLCPSHSDANPSFSLTERDGKILTHCFAGCTFDAIRQALGMTGKPMSGSRPDYKPTPPPEPPKPQPLPNRPTDTRYPYMSAEGEVVMVVVRHDWPNRPKTFSQWIPTKDKDKWLPTGLTGKKPLYNLPDVLDSNGKVAVVEGEKCAIAAKTAWPTQTVTTWAGGANAWSYTDWTPLKGRGVSLLADGDEPGHKAMKDLAAHLHELGCKVKIALPPVDWKTDVADWLERDGKDATAQRIVKMLNDYGPQPQTQLAPLAEDAVEQGLIQDATNELVDNEHYKLLGVGWHPTCRAIAASGRGSTSPPRAVYDKGHSGFDCAGGLVRGMGGRRKTNQRCRNGYWR